MYTWMFRRYRTNTLADGGSISDKPVLGPELIPDASRWFDIDNDPYWKLGVNQTISGGLLHYNNSPIYSAASKSNILTKGKLYKITFTITNYISGRFALWNSGGIFNGLEWTSNGTYTLIYRALDTVIFLEPWGSGNNTFDIDNISVREVLINSVTTDYLKMSQNNRIDKSIRFGWLGEAGSKIESGRVEKLYDINCFEQLGAELVTNGDFSNGITGWGFDASWSVSNGSLNCIGGQASTKIAYPSSAFLVANKLYKITYTISSYTSGAIHITFEGGLSTTLTRSQVGVYTDYMVATSTGNFYIRNINGTFIGSLDNISVKEVLNATNTNNATQPTPTSRPYLTGNIAPNEKLGLKNPNGGSNFMTHPTISFAANEAWSVTTVLNWNGSDTETSLMIGGASSIIGLRGISGLNIFLRSNEVTTYSTGVDIRYLVGKLTTLTLSYVNGELKVYINSVLRSTVSCSGTYIFSRILTGGATSAKTTIKSYIIRSQALTQQQVTVEYTYLRSVYPEIESVDIGTQTWATSNCEMAATPQGNVIQEIQAAGNVEKITNGGFNANINGLSQLGNHTVIWDSEDVGVAKITSSGVGSVSTNYIGTTSSQFIVGRFYKVTFSVKSVSGNTSLQYQTDNVSTGMNTTNITTTYQTFTEYRQAQNVSGICRFWLNGEGVFILDNISIQEIGWSGSQELYDGIYAQTAGTVEQKTYAAVKAAAMWCHYNNSVDNGAIYGKLYNWFAVRLLRMDIDYFNAANPTTPWGWRVPTQSDFNTLATTLGGLAVAGGKMKLSGTTYWNSPNVGGTNESGFSAIGSGRRVDNTGSFQLMLGANYSWCDAEASSKPVIYVSANSLSMEIAYQPNGYGNSLRLIKST